MKRIEAFIRPHKLEDVTERLRLIGVKGMTLDDVHGVGPARPAAEGLRNAPARVGLVPKVHLDLVVPDDLAEPVARAIYTAGRTGQEGDGKVIVSPVDDAVRIRTGEHGDDAL